MTTHLPVLLAEVIDALAVKPGGLYVDVTFGRGGYSRALLAAGGVVIGLDRDPDAVKAGEDLARENPNFTMIHGAFSGLEEHLSRPLASAKVAGVDGIAFDLGVSSPQLDNAERGFSFRQDGPLDMRMDTTSGLSAADLVNTLEERELADLIWTYGEERYARRVASALVKRRSLKLFTRTGELAEVVRAVVRASPSGKGIDPATRTFQAFRLAVNDELRELEQGLAAALRLLNPGGRVAVVSFHSLEDRIVKNVFRTASGRTARPSRYLPAREGETESPFALVGPQPVTPGLAECTHNPRARSARLRVLARASGPAVLPSLSVRAVDARSVSR